MSFSGLNPPETSALISIEAPQTVRLWCLTSDGGMLGGRLVGENHARVYWKAWQARCSWTFHDSRPAFDIRVVVASQTEETIGGKVVMHFLDSYRNEVAAYQFSLLDFVG